MLKSQSQKYTIKARKSKVPKITRIEIDWKDKNTRRKHQSEHFVREITYKGGRGAKAPRPPL